MPCTLEVLTIIKTSVVGQLFSDCRRTGEMQNNWMSSTNENKQQKPKQPKPNKQPPPRKEEGIQWTKWNRKTTLSEHVEPLECFRTSEKWFFCLDAAWLNGSKLSEKSQNCWNVFPSKATNSKKQHQPRCSLPESAGASEGGLFLGRLDQGLVGNAESTHVNRPKGKAPRVLYCNSWKNI